MRMLDKYYDFVRCNPDYKSFEEYWKANSDLSGNWSTSASKYLCEQAYELAQAQKVIEDLTTRIKVLEDMQSQPNQYGAV